MQKADAKSIEEKLVVLMDMLEEEGFMPEFNIDNESDRLTIKECNCPFSEVVKETQLPCKLEAMFFKRLFNEEVKRTSHIAEGDFSCTYNIPTDA